MNRPTAVRTTIYCAPGRASLLASIFRNILTPSYLTALILLVGLGQNALSLIMGVVGMLESQQTRTLGTHIFLNALSSHAMTPSFPVAPFGILSVAIALLTWVWTSVLYVYIVQPGTERPDEAQLPPLRLAYNRRPSSKMWITRAGTHSYSLVVLGVLWLGNRSCSHSARPPDFRSDNHAIGIFIMFGTEIHQQCIVLPELFNSVTSPSIVTPTDFCPEAISTVVIAFVVIGLSEFQR